MQNKRRKAALTAAAAAAAAGVMLGSAFADPVDLLQPDSAVSASTDAAGDDGGDGGESEELRGLRRARSQVNRGVREGVLSLPAWVRAMVAFPLWCLGWALLQLGGLAWPFLSPVVNLLCKWVLTGVVVFLVFAASMKLACPELPLRKIFTRRSFGTILVLLALFGAADAVLPLLWEDYRRFAPLLHLLGGGLTLGVPMVALLRRQRREARAAEEDAESAEERVRRVAWELADSVCQPRMH